MPLQNFFEGQFFLIRKFMTGSGEVVRCIRVDPDFKDLLLKALCKIDDDDPNITLVYDKPFRQIETFFDGLLEVLRSEYEKYRSALEKEQIYLNINTTGVKNETQIEQFVRVACSFSDQLPETIGSVVFLLDTDGTEDKENFKKTLKLLTQQITSQWVKFLIIDTRVTPVLEGLEADADKYGFQEFYMPPDQIEQSVANDLRQPFLLSPTERRRYIALLGGFAFSNKKYDEALTYQTQWLQESEKDNDPAEMASACYNIGNTFLAQKRYETAEEFFLKACQLCLDHHIDAVLPLLLVNLGTTLYHQKRLDESVSAFEVAIQNFESQNLQPGIAHGYDCLASVYFSEKLYDLAEIAWQKALATYQKITSDAFQDTNEAGRKDIEQKLKHLSATRNQKEN
jgi:tetratricopeptide (TPR) repeat protein